MSYTLDYLKGDTKGQAKEEAEVDIHRVAAGKGDLYDKFCRVCRDNGIDPERAITDMVFKVMSDESFAEAVLEADPYVDDLRTPEEQKKDLEFLLELREEYGLDEQGGIDMDVEGLIQDRLQASVGSPLDALEPSGGGGGGGGQANGQLTDVIERMDRRLAKLEQEVSSEEPQVVEVDEGRTGQDSEDRRQSKIEELRDLADDEDESSDGGDEPANNEDRGASDGTESQADDEGNEGSGDGSDESVEMGFEGEPEDEGDAGEEVEQFGEASGDGAEGIEDEFDDPMFDPDDGEVSEDE